MPRPRVLLIEDDQAIREILYDALTAEDWAVEATNGPAAIGRARAFAPDVILLDLHMPGTVSGEEVYRRLRADPALAPIPVCISSAKWDAAAIADQLQAEGTLLKPFELILLEDELHKLVQLSYERRKRAEQAAQQQQQ